LFGNILAQKPIIDDKKIGFGKVRGLISGTFELIEYKQMLTKSMSFVINDLVAGLNRGMSHKYGNMDFAR
jgi:hypothetical protein